MDINFNIIKTPFTESDLEKVAILPEWEKVYHITSVAALEKIVSERIIRFFSLSGMNDKDEIKNYFAEVEPESRKLVIDGNDFDSILSYYQQTSFSFSTSYMPHSDPELWKEYSKGMEGVRIEFNLKKLIQSVLRLNYDKLNGTKLYYGQVLYKTEVKKFFLNNSINNFFNRFKEMLGMPPKPVIRCPIFVVEEADGKKNFRQLAGCLPSFSKEYTKWAKEKEIRLCFYSESDEVYKNINGKSYIPMFFDPSCIEGIDMPPSASAEDIGTVNRIMASLSVFR